MLRVLCALALAGVGSSQSLAVLVYEGTSLTQSFNSLATGGTANSWTNDTSPLAGWSLFRRTGSSDATPVAITSYRAGTGSDTTSGVYSFGPSANSDRALGAIGSGTATWGSASNGQVAGWIAVAIQNGTEGVLNEFTVAFDGEQWRRAANLTAHTMTLEYGFGSDFSSVTNWVAPGGNFDWTGPRVGATGSAIDGNGPADGLVAGRGGTISSLTWVDDATLWIRWVEVNDANEDHGLAIDNFSFSATAAATVPEASAAIFGALACCAFAALRCMRRR